ncbi:zinc finger protein ZFP2-like [Planococcus citri]|uniref:zinc finger protein ZFP2-like n=1 Tax=Planococcus citri TaxID=170843 RepID=UPI0031F9E3BA
MDLYSVDELIFFCRLCLQRCGEHEFVDIYKDDDYSTYSKELTLSHKISACVSIELSLFNHEPRKICIRCLNHINAWFDFKTSCNAANDVLQKYLRNAEEKNTPVFSGTKTEDSLCFPEVSLLSCDTLLEKSMSLNSNISSIVHYFLNPEKNDDKIGTESQSVEVADSFSQEIRPCDDNQKSTFNSSPIFPPAKMDEAKSINDGSGYHCTLCYSNFNNFSSFLSHDETIHSTEMRKYSCTVCGRLFISQDRLNIHTRLTHREKTHQCEVCDKLFVSKKSLQVHSRLHTEKYKCEKCGFLSTSKLYLNQHMQKHDSSFEFFTCDICQQKFSQKQSLLRHSKLHSKNHGKCFKCSICYLLFRSNSELVAHKSNTHNGTNTSRTLKCRTCNELFSSRKTLIVHQKRHQEPQFNCSVCEKKFKSNYDLRIHMGTHSDSKNFSCFHCNKKFSFNKSLTKHLKNYCPRVRSDLIVV